MVVKPAPADGRTLVAGVTQPEPPAARSPQRPLSIWELGSRCAKVGRARRSGIRRSGSWAVVAEEARQASEHLKFFVARVIGAEVHYIVAHLPHFV